VAVRLARISDAIFYASADRGTGQPPPGDQENLADHFVGELPAGQTDRVGVDAAVMLGVEGTEPLDRLRIGQDVGSLRRDGPRLRPSSGNAATQPILTGAGRQVPEYTSPQQG
jgi:hypothetical protein